MKQIVLIAVLAIVIAACAPQAPAQPPAAPSQAPSDAPPLPAPTQQAPTKEPQPTPATPSEPKTFEDKLVAQAVENGGGMMPIEGWDAQLLLGQFPGLLEQDFRGVDTLGGEYVITAGGLGFQRDADQSPTTADQTLSRLGFVQLKSHLAKRLNTDDEDRIIELIQEE